MSIRSVIVSTGSYLPSRVLTNKDLEAMVETSDEWIVKRSGIRERRIAGAEETTGTMAVAAARRALERSDLKPEDIGGVIVATTTPDRIFPSVAVKVQAELGIPHGPAFDIQAVCTGFVYALSVADSLLRTGAAKSFIVIGAEKMSAIVDWTDRTTCVLFADGAGAVVLRAEEGVAPGDLDARGVISTHLYANGSMRDILYTDGGPSSSGGSGKIVMHGREVFKYAVEYMADIVEETLRKNKIGAEAIDWLVPHQANIRIIEATAKKLGLSMEKVVVTVDRHGNTSAASIPLALDEAVSDGRIRKGDLLLLEAMGGGLTWGAALLRF